VNLRFAKPLDYDTIDELAAGHDLIVTMEENSIAGGISQNIAAHLQWNGYKGNCISVSLPDDYIEHGDQELLKKINGLDAESIADRIRGLVS